MMACDLLILSNGPGEISTWVRPVVQALRSRGDRLRISVVLSPCANASGREAAMARQIPGVDRVQSAQHFFPFLLTGKTADHWDWHPQGVVLFLGVIRFFRSSLAADWAIARWSMPSGTRAGTAGSTALPA